MAAKILTLPNFMGEEDAERSRCLLHLAFDETYSPNLSFKILNLSPPLMGS